MASAMLNNQGLPVIFWNELARRNRPYFSGFKRLILEEAKSEITPRLGQHNQSYIQFVGNIDDIYDIYINIH